MDETFQQVGMNLSLNEIAPALLGQPVLDEAQTIEEAKRGNIFSRNAAKLAIGASAASIAVTLVTDPLAETGHQIAEAAPYFFGGMAAGEAMWIGGAAMMLAAIGSKIKNPMKIKSSIPEISEKANDSLMFKSGFWINTVGAVGEFAVAASAVSTNLPAKSWGILALPFLDLGITVSVRRAIRNGIKRNV